VRAAVAQRGGACENRYAMRLDAHQHFWKYTPEDYGWITDEMSILKRDYLPQDLEPLLAQAGFDGSIAVQARHSADETHWLLDLADQHAFIKGVVGWVDLCSPALREQLEPLASRKYLLGIRHIVQAEPDDEFMLRPDFRRGIAQIADFGLTYDLLLYPRHLPVAVKLVAEFPGQTFVLDHIAKPGIAAREIAPWDRNIAELAKFPNVFCKLSGMVTEARWKHWTAADFLPYLDSVFEAFGPSRLIIGSDWPVCTVAGDYASIIDIVTDYITRLTASEQGAILGENCARVYGV
jgi:L-fuconolactonase